MAIGCITGLRLDRTGAAIVGAGLLLGTGVLTIDEAWRAIHYETILLLFGMMIVVANLRLAGFFPLVAQRAVRRASPRATLLNAIVTTAVLSALFVSDTISIVMTPLVIEITRSLQRRPLPLPARRRHRLQHRQRGHDHRQSAKHDDRRLLRDPLSPRSLCSASSSRSSS